MGRTSAPRRRVALLSISFGRRSRRGREVLLGKQDLPKSGTARLRVPLATDVGIGTMCVSLESMTALMAVTQNPVLRGTS